MTFNSSQNIRITPLGGLPNVHDNMFVYETDDDIFIVDCGLGFPDEGVSGVDLTIPDITYLKGKEHKIRGFVVSHGHEDHIGGFPYIIPQLPAGIPIYASKLPAGLLREKFKEFAIDPNIINVIGDRQPIQLGVFEVKMIPVNHSIPDTKHLIIKTPHGNIYHGSDFKFDWTPIGQEVSDIQSITKAGAEGVTLLMSDCLRSEKPGHSLSEATVEDSFEREFRGASGRVVVTTMSSSIGRIQQALWVAKRSGRKVAFVGFSIERNVRVASKLGFLKIPPRLVLDKRKIRSLPREEQCLIVAGSQGQLGSSLDKIATGVHHTISLDPGDKVVFSADPIPGNENNVYRLIDMLAEHRLEVSYSDISDDLHVSGHASSSELLMLMAMTKPKYVLGTGGTYRHMVQYAKLARKMGYDDEHILMPEDRQIVISQAGVVSLGEPVKVKTVYVESGEITRSDKAIQDRKLMFQEGVVVTMITLNANGFEVDLIPKGLTKYLKPQMMDDIKAELVSALDEKDLVHDRLYSRDKIAKEVGRLFVDKIGKNPVVIPVIINNE